MALRQLFPTPVYEASLSTDRKFENFRAELEGACRMLAAEDSAIAEILTFIGDGKHRALCLPADDGNRH